MNQAFTLTHMGTKINPFEIENKINLVNIKMTPACWAPGPASQDCNIRCQRQPMRVKHGDNWPNTEKISLKGDNSLPQYENTYLTLHWHQPVEIRDLHKRRPRLDIAYFDPYGEDKIFLQEQKTDCLVQHCNLYLQWEANFYQTVSPPNQCYSPINKPENCHLSSSGLIQECSGRMAN